MADSEIPMPRILDLKGQGMSNNQIIQTLQRQGYSSTQIFDALSKSASQPQQPSPQPSLNTPASRVPNMPGGGMPAPPMMGGGGFDSGADQEELIEAIIDEKWNDLMGDINKVIAWKEATEARITKIEQMIKDTKDQFDKLHQAIVGKVNDYDQHILEVGAEVKAMEKVFSKVLPVFTDNVAELSRVADELKKPVSKK